MMKGVIFDIKHFAVHDGPGIRQTIFFKGCPLGCKWCHNPESQLADFEEFEANRKIASKAFKRIVTIGKDVTVEELISEIEKDIPFFDESGGGVTFSGGEPMMQFDFLLSLAKECHKRAVNVAVDTSGYAPMEYFQQIAPYVNLFLYDLKLMNNNVHKEYTGVSNQIIFENLLMLDSLKSSVKIRLPLIHDITTTKENIEAIADFVSSLININEINILPYHDISTSKYERFKKNYALSEIRKMNDEEISSIKDYFQSKGINTKIEQ